jgi:hypothetical protein
MNENNPIRHSPFAIRLFSREPSRTYGRPPMNENIPIRHSPFAIRLFSEEESS